LFLKCIEIQGFKSFAHKTVLNFNEGMTAIVGPNGSGKSNIADAVRWVLGEQKVKQLRGSSMQDVIFAGTELRKPLGFAFVSMTFDNSDRALNLDYSEVTVSRRLYRSGESEYMLNGQNVRLKDVQELFFDTGIGKEGYSIIGQGQIEAIVSGRPEDRRGLFDEACGIVKFKKRKQAAVKKLEEEEINLTRITDIKNELERRIGPLEKQSVNAKEYLRLRDILKKYELTIFVQETEDILNALSENEKNTSIVNDSIEAIRSEGDKLRSMNQELVDSIRETEAAINAGKDDKLKGELLITNLESQISVAETEITAEQSNIGLFEESLEKLACEKDTRTDTVVSYLKSIEQFKNDFSLIGDGNAAFSESEEVDTVKALLDGLVSYETELRDVLPEGTDINKNNETEAQDEDEFCFEEPEWLRSIKNKQDDLQEISERSEKISDWIKTASDEYNTITEEIRELGENRNQLATERNIIESKLETLRNISERYEGYGTTVQAVMQLKSTRKGINGVVADLIRTKHEYEVAIETALGNRIQNVVTDTEKTAKELIVYLKKNKLGRATFLPLDAVRQKVQEEYRKAVSEPGCIGLASDIIETSEEYEELALALLGNTLVFDHVDHALQAAARYKHGLRIVTLEGELLSPGGAIAGGTYRNSSNLMGRTRELRELEEEITSYTGRIRQVSEKIREAENRSAEKSGELEELQKQQKEINEEKNSLSYGLVSDMKLKISNLKQSVEFITENVQRILSEINLSINEHTALLSKIENSKRLISEKQKQILDRKEDIAHVRTGLEESLRKAEEAQNRKEELTSSQSRYFERRDAINEETLNLEKDLIRLENTKEKLGAKLDSLTGHIWDEYGLTLTDAEKESDETLGSLQTMRSEVNRLNGEIKELGIINIQAIEEYREVSGRYELLKTQHADITAAREQILGIITELDEGMKEQFNEQFECIRLEFSKVFRELFGGGEATLELCYDEEAETEQDELSAGISINAQPPGKKLQNMMQLSGGEKAFTAIALLFAIQNLKPSPFCLLDEIEAALDDSNVFRFAQYIRRICGRSQFILITHRRGTMEAADRLYGITMQEKGVTSLVSVDLVEDSVN